MIWLKIFCYKVFIHIKLKLHNFLMDSIFNFIYSVVIMVLLMGLVKHIRGPHVQRKNCYIIMITFNKNCNIESVLGLRLVSLLVASLETQGQSVRAAITVARVFKKELNQMLVSDWAQKVIFLCPFGGQHLSCCSGDLLIWRSLPANSTICTCLARIGVWRAFFEKSFQWKWGPQKQRNLII